MADLTIDELLAAPRPKSIAWLPDVDKRLWGDLGGIKMRHRRYFMKQVAKRLRDHKTLHEYAVPIINTEPRGLIRFVYPKTGLRTVDEHGKIKFIIPCGAAKEGIDPMVEGWQGTIRSDYAVAMSDALNDFVAGVPGAE